MASPRELKEAFVTGYEGGSPYEILLIISSVAIGLIFYQSFSRLIDHGWEEIMLEALAFPIPIILCQSVYLYESGVSYLVILLVCSFLALTIRVPVESTAASKRQKDAVTIYRSSMMLLTFVAILAVDFKVFPRRFVKTETHGYSLMDVGAASFVVAAGFVSPRARGKKGISAKPSRILSVMAMGMIRLATHKGIEYQEHASEYGIHWNFFFTLAFLILVPSLFPGPSFVLPVIIMFTYQYALIAEGVQEWIVEASRETQGPLYEQLFAANREGILGCVGFSALYLMGEFVAKTCFWDNPHTYMSTATILAYSAWRLLEAAGIEASRRSTNITFCAWSLFVNCLLLTLIQELLRVCPSPKLPPVLSAINSNGLIIFILANLLTGVVNLSVDTLVVSDEKAVSIVFGYIAAVSGVAILAQWLKLSFKG